MYGIRKEIADEFGACSIPGFGAVKPALTRLENDNYIKSRKAISDGGKLTGYYTIMNEGKEKLRRLILEPLSENPLQFFSNSAIKLSCAGFLSPLERKKLFFDIKTKAQTHKITAKKISEKENLNFYQRIMSDFAMNEYKNFNDIIESLEKENARNSK